MIKAGWNLLICLFVSTFLSSCGMSNKMVNISGRTVNQHDNTVQQISISSFWEKVFTGIIAITFVEDKIHYALLDAMGVKLLEADIFSSDNYVVTGGIKKLMDSSLPGVMAESLMRIYRIEPSQQPCSSSFWNTLCQKKLDDGSRIKYCRSGLFVLWKARFPGNTDTVIYNRPLIGFTLKLTLVQSTSTQGGS